ncbi:MAG: dihydroneopterin aldolase [Armatimonadetes bacterium]|nr:dihydroneopterin aldolase [Armatimonadota bacterium]
MNQVWKRKTGQPFCVDVEIKADLRKAGTEDSLSQTVDYASVFTAAKEVLEGPPCNLLETLAERISRKVLDLGRAASVTIRIRKPKVPLPGPIEYAEVEITRP